MLRCYLMDPDTDVCQTEQPQISYSVDFTAEQSSAMGSPILLGRGGTIYPWSISLEVILVPTLIHHDPMVGCRRKGV